MDHSSDEQALEDFVLREAVRQQIDTLEQAAELSPQQRAVWQRLRMGMTIPKIAVELGITKNQVSAQKHYAIKKLGAARKVADL